MHIAEGVLSTPVLVVGHGAAVAGIFIGLRNIDLDDVVRVSVLSSAFFIGSLVHVPVGPVSAHLVLNGLMGVILGWAAFPAIFVALVLQAVMFGFGGITTLGINTLDMALPAVVAYYLFNPFIRRSGQKALFALGFAAGALTVALTALCMGAALIAVGREYVVVVYGILLANLPLMIVEGFVTGSIITFLRKVRPEMLHPPAGRIRREDASRA